MNLENLGYNPDTGIHSIKLTPYESTFLGLLWVDHVGKENRISANALATLLHYTLDGIRIDEDSFDDLVKEIAKKHSSTLGKWKRDLRHLHNHLLIRHPNIPLFSSAGYHNGYFIGATKAEADEFYDTFRMRGMTGLIKASRGKKAVLADMVKQLTFEFENMSGESPGTPLPGDQSVHIEVVDALLEKMTREPERFAGELRRLGKKFGSVLLPKDQVRAMMTKADELRKLMAEIGV